MSYCKTEGKDKIIFATKEDHDKESSVLLEEPEEAVGLLFPNGDINWGCPCLGGMATGPCGVQFREAFSCFHYSKAEPKGSDCYEPFKVMQDCMTQYPAVYHAGGDDDADKDELGMDSLEEPDDTTNEQLEKIAVDTIAENSPGKIEGKNNNLLEDSIKKS